MLAVIVWYLVIFLIGVLAAPVGKYFLGSLKDYGYPFYRIIGLGFVSFLVWILGSLKVLPFNSLNVGISMVVLAAASFGLIHFRKIGFDRDFFKKALVYEGLFIAFYALFLTYRLYHSGIKDIEKFMDFAFLNALLRTDYFPPQDPWLAGQAVNYYYFGHVVTAVLTKLSSIKSGITFNLMVATNYVFYVLGIFSIVYNLTKKYAWASFSVVVAAFMANISFFIGLITQRQASVWWADATRIIPGTINEFPLYSFLLGDLHAHYLDLPFVLLMIIFLYVLLKEEVGWAFHLVLGLLFSIMFITNSWDYLIYVVFYVAVLAYKYGFSVKGVLRSLRYGLLAGITSLIGLMPFYLNFHPGSSGFQLVTAPRTTIKDFLILFSLQFFAISFYLIYRFAVRIKRKKEFALPFLVAAGTGAFVFKSAQILPFLFVLIFLLTVLLVEDREKDKEGRFVYLLIFMSLFLVLFCEIFYLKDIYGIEYQRANTIFKLYYQLWVYLSIVVVWVGHYFYEKAGRLSNAFFYPAGILFLFSVLYLPQSVYSSADNFKKLWGLDGTKYLATEYPYDMAAINWLNKNIQGPAVILEKPGESYTLDSRVSNYTGLATPLGWLGHEWGWHGSPDGLFEKRDEMKEIYETPNPKRASALIQKYKIEYIYVGEMERKDLAIKPEAAFYKLGQKVYQTSEVEILKVKG